MKALKLSLVIMAAALVTISLSGMAYAFHSGGVAQCEGCHTMHNSLGGVTVRKGGTVFQGVNWLLKGSDQSSTCLNCHGTTAATYNSTSNFPFTTTNVTSGGPPPAQRTPGGDFGWLYKSYAPVSGQHFPASPGYLHGHNINAGDYSLPALGEVLSSAPGGTMSGGSYLQSNFYCTSCHNPHSSTRIVSNNPVVFQNSALGTVVAPIVGSGSYGGADGTPLPSSTGAMGVYRLLGGIGYVPLSYSGGPPFIYNPPVAVAPTTYNVTEASYDCRVAYGTGMSEWCANCHYSIYTLNASGLTTPHIHPAGINALLAQAANISGTTTSYQLIYEAYKASGNLTGSAGTSYWSLVPYEEQGANGSNLTSLASHAYSGLSGTLYTNGPTIGTETVSCLSCHRAHATGFNQMTRWNNNSEFVVVAGLWPDSANATSAGYSNGMPGADYSAAMYDRPASNYATYQRVFCNKCHAKD